jgi:two-component system sensor histidine kinase SenX3
VSSWISEILSGSHRSTEKSATSGEALTALQIAPILPDIVLVVDAEAKVLFASEPARSLGLVEQNVVSKAAVKELIDLARSGEDIRNELVEIRRPLPARGTVSLGISVAVLSDQTVFLVGTDLTAAQRLEQVRRDFVANISHELKTPVGALSVLMEAVVEAGDDIAAVNKFVNRMQSEVLRLNNMVRDLVDLSRMQSDDPLASPTAVPIDRVVSEAVESVQFSAEGRGITIGVTGDQGSYVAGDEMQLVAALRNLLTNALAYSADNTQITVGVKVADELVEITVADQGIGISRADQERIFERFYRVDQARSRATGGTGLGLAIVKNVCMNHGGEVSLWSVVGEGSTFTLRFPAFEHMPPTPEAEAASSSRESKSEQAK